MFKITFLFFISLSIFSCSLIEQDNTRSFEKESWINDKEHRYEMSDDLMKNYLSTGMPESEVDTLLGNPDYINSNNKNEYHMGSGMDYTYILYIEYENEIVLDYYDKKQYW